MMHMADQTTGPDQTGARAHRPAGTRSAARPDQTNRTGPRRQTTAAHTAPAGRQTTADRTGQADQTTEVTR
jgi:hypothetical protein